MRLDKFLKISRIIKRRTVAKEFAESERAFINGRLAKPSSEVKKGDIITLKMGDKELTFEVLDVRENVKANEAKNLYRIIE
ncbi:Ribosomal 50S subunit-recycling heat shock protein, contains S4 domain [Thermosyntropha lipolytica DSM 11003]|uniref:RQC P-site tRNA stabilizing factor n=1 Tax=Thermosyntropha lipolytica DSM 11003 TaxID=1123382 RepID=A0A1M5JSK7_9FIRM|nr:RNA-binding S4 domain-containing protein [Thermosyntropha lipolytica]SHG43526.1 Ribosomal 50S subunit-recycling heat shock protein, contains S4 domain [Thermosyntropha lipolytica DSM 11003]